MDLFRLVPKSTTLDDLEWPLRTLFQNTCVFGAHHQNLYEDRPYLTPNLTRKHTLILNTRKH